MRMSKMTDYALRARSTLVSALENSRKSENGVLVDSVRSGGPCAESKSALRPEHIITRLRETNIDGALLAGAHDVGIVRAAKVAAHSLRKVTRLEYHT